MDVNVKSALIISQIIVKDMIKNGIKGSIVNVSSQASMVALPNHTSYCSSKACLDQLTRMMCLELGQYGINVNAVNPTVVLTEMGKQNWSDPKVSEPMLKRIPMGVKNKILIIFFLIFSFFFIF